MRDESLTAFDGLAKSIPDDAKVLRIPACQTESRDFEPNKYMSPNRTFIVQLITSKWPMTRDNNFVKAVNPGGRHR